jgi:hypothetical protein
MLKTNLITSSQWKEARKDQPLKWKHARHFDKFNKSILKFASEFDGELNYYTHPEPTLETKMKMEYSENSPIFHFFKIVPYGFYLYNYDKIDMWKKIDIDSNILEKYNRYSTNKYDQKSKLFEFEKDYILFPLQSLWVRFDITMFIKCIKWAEQNKKYIIFKKHPFSKDGDHIDQIWKHLLSKKIITKYAILLSHDYNLDNLIDHCKMVWCFSSGSGMQALLKHKPVSFFQWDEPGRKRPCVDYAPIAKFCTSPEAAYNNIGMPDEEVKRFFSWYYHKLIIDLEDAGYEKKLYNRLNNYYKHERCIDDIF